MNKIVLFLVVLLCTMEIACTAVNENYDSLKFDSEDYSIDTLIMNNSDTIIYKAYKNIYYVTNVEDSNYQYLNIYVPENVKLRESILLRTYVGGYMATKAYDPSPNDATGRALKEGFVVCIPGSRGWNSVIESDGKKIYTGRAPAGILDLKAAVRYLRFNDMLIPGNSERIITDGTSAGGAMSSLLGSSGNSPIFKSFLKEMGAADVSDGVFASICYCPIVDLEHSDISYEWLYSVTNKTVRGLNKDQLKVSNELAAMFGDYLNSLNLVAPWGEKLNSRNYYEYLKGYIIESANRAMRQGVELPADIGLLVGNGKVLDVDMGKYLSYVAKSRPLKTPPAFDAIGVVDGNRPTPENLLFGDASGSFVNFTEYASMKRGNDLSSDIQAKVAMMNPMFHLLFPADRASHWYIRHGSRDRDTGFSVPINLATKLSNVGCSVNFSLAWNRGHEGDYDLDDLFAWIANLP
ncbi:MAG: alpha/beta hydrolase [Bacteroidales bacterium]|nr:alpha/beta hydrolase [Bacteroidales bacterium]